MNEETRYDLIDRYLKGDLKKDHPFFEQLEKDESLREEVETQRLVADAVIDYRLIQVEALVESYRQKAIRPENNYKKWLWWALPVVLVGSLAPFFSTKEGNSPSVTVESKRELAPKAALPEHKATMEMKSTPSTHQETSVAVKKESAPATEQLEVENKPTLVPQEQTTIHIAPSSSVSTETKELPASNNLAAEQKLPVPDPCLSAHFKAFVYETRPCRGKNEGMLEIQQAKGGTPPYLYSLDKGKTYHKEALFKQLSAGNYTISIKDDNGCEGIIYAHFALDPKTCSDLAQYSFNPHVETWEPPLTADKSGNITIVDRFGNQLYLRNFSQNERLIWDGSALNGQLLSAGSYVYTITYGDGTIERGNVTLAY